MEIKKKKILSIQLKDEINARREYIEKSLSHKEDARESNNFRDETMWYKICFTVKKNKKKITIRKKKRKIY